MNDTTRDPQAPSAYPWFIAFVCMFTLFLSNGMTATGITIFDPSLLDEFGWSRGDFKLRDLLNFVMVALFWLMVGINVLEARRLFPARLPQVKTVVFRKPLLDGARP